VELVSSRRKSDLYLKIDIIRGNREFDKKHLEQLVVKYGGDFCQKRTDKNEATIISSVDTSEPAKDCEAVT
jgi:hypothetical protein